MMFLITLSLLRHLAIKRLIDCNYGMSTMGTLDTIVAMGVMNDDMNDLIIKTNLIV